MIVNDKAGFPAETHFSVFHYDLFKDILNPTPCFTNKEKIDRIWDLHKGTINFEINVFFFFIKKIYLNFKKQSHIITFLKWVKNYYIVICLSKYLFWILTR